MIKKLTATIGFAVLVVLIAALSLVFAPMLKQYRTAFVEVFFGSLLDRHVVIAGDIEVSLGAMARIGLSNVTISDREGSAKTGTASIERTEFTLPYGPTLHGLFEPDDVAISGMDFELFVAERATGARESARVFIDFVGWLLDENRTPKLLLEDIVIARREDPAGWNQTIVLTSVEMDTRVNSVDAATLRASGALNNAHFSLDAQFGALDNDPAHGANREVNVHARLGATDFTLQGRLEPAAKSIDAQLQVTSKSLAQLLGAFRIAAQTDGTGELLARLHGPIDEMAAERVQLQTAFKRGESVSASGSVANVFDVEGVNLDIAVELPRGKTRGAVISTALDVRLRGVKGQIISAGNGLEIPNLALSTSIASAEFHEIGPISVAKIVRDKRGRLGLLGVRLLEGDPADPVFDVQGDIHDTFGLAEMSFTGRFNFDLVALLAQTERASGDTRLAGSLSISDASGRLDIDKVDAATTSGVFSLMMTKRSTEAPLHVVFSAADIDEVAAAVGRPPIGGGAASFDAEFVTVDDLALTGEIAIGETRFSETLRLDVKSGQPILRGTIDASTLRLSDIRRAAALGKIFKPSTQGIDFERAFSDGFDAELDLTATQLSRLDQANTGLEAHLSYQRRKAVFAPLKLQLYDGVIDATLTIDTQHQSPGITLTGEASNIDVAALLAQFEAEPMLTGKLHARADLTGLGTNKKAIINALGGSLEVALVDAVFGSRLIDLAGQDIVSWLFSGGTQGRALLECAVTGIAFTNGIGVFQPLVVATENVQLTGQGNLDIRDETIKIAFQPRPQRPHLVDIVTPFRVEGPLNAPAVTGIDAATIVERVGLEIVTLPLRPIDLLVRHQDSAKDNSHHDSCRKGVGDN